MSPEPKKILLILSTFVLLVPLTLVALGSGQIHFSLSQTWAALVSPTNHPLAANVIVNLRLPRILGALLIGAALSMSGVAFQNLFANPLVSPDLLGVSNGAAVGAAIAITISTSPWLVQILALIGGVIAVGLTIMIPKLLHQRGTLILVLAGIIISGFMQAILGLIKYLADPESQLPSIVYWQLGSLAKVDFKALSFSLPMMVTGFIILLLFRWHLTILALGTTSATSQGLAVVKERSAIIVGATLLTAAAVCLAGTIGWIGLVIPHIARRIIGANTRFALPLAGVLGGAFLLVIDTLARTLSSGEIPLSILTGFIGTPLFIAILWQQKGDIR